MRLFPEVSVMSLVRVLLPFVLSILAAAIVIFGYVSYSGSLTERAEELCRERALETAKNLSALSMNSDLSDLVFTTSSEEGYISRSLIPELLGPMNLSEMKILYLPADRITGSEYIVDDTLAAAALGEMQPVLERVQSGKDANLAVYYPLESDGGDVALGKFVFLGYLNPAASDGILNLYLLAAGAMVLLILPAAFFRLAEVRRSIEIRGFYRQTPDFDPKADEKQSRGDLCPSKLLDGAEFPGLFRLDEKGEILHMNKPAERILDLSSEDTEGLKFHQLPCISKESRSRIEYPEEDDSRELTIDLEDSLGNTREIGIRIEGLGSSGYAVSVRKSAAGDSRRMDSNDEYGGREGAGYDLSAVDDLRRIRQLLKDARTRFAGNRPVLEHLEQMQKVLSGRESFSLTGYNIGSIEVTSELKSIANVLNDVLPERASIEIDAPGILPDVDCSREDFTQLVKNIVFYSLESASGPVRIKLSAREVPSPVSDPVFSASCDRTVPRSVSLSYSDGTRMPVVLKEALLDPETDLVGIQRDYGSHISSVAEVLSELDCHPVFTERSEGTSLNVLFTIIESSLQEFSQTRSVHDADFSGIDMILCDSSRVLRHSVSEALSLYGVDVRQASDMESVRKLLADSPSDCIVLDCPVCDDEFSEILRDITADYPNTSIVITAGSASGVSIEAGSLPRGVRMLQKPYSIDELLNIVEILSPGQSGMNPSFSGAEDTYGI